MTDSGAARGRTAARRQVILRGSRADCFLSERHSREGRAHVGTLAPWLFGAATKTSGYRVVLARGGNRRASIDERKLSAKRGRFMGQIEIDYAGKTYTVPWTDENREELKALGD